MWERTDLRMRSVVGLSSLIGLAVLTGCPSVDPGNLAPEIVEGGPALELHAVCRYSANQGGANQGAVKRGDADGPGAEVAPDDRGLARIERILGEGGTRGFRVETGPDRLLVEKTVEHGPGLLRELELNRFFASLLMGAAEDQSVSFFREDELIAERSISDLRREAGRGDGVTRVDLGREVFRIYDGATIMLYRFKRAALRIPFDKVSLEYQAEASQLTIEIRDEESLAALHREVGWKDRPDEGLGVAEDFAERMMTERRIFVAIGGVVIVDDQIRPGAQTVVESDGVRWTFGGMVTPLERDWAQAAFGRETGRTLRSIEVRAGQ